MSLSDYKHWGEDAHAIWWEEEGRWAGQQDPPEQDDFYTPSGAQMDFDDAFDEGYYDGDNGDPLNDERYDRPDMQQAYADGYRDGECNRRNREESDDEG